jgi:hypothetical protein
MANKRDIKEIKACVKELEERIFNKYKYIVIFENLCEVIDDVFSTIYEALDRTRNIEYLRFIRMAFNFTIPEKEKKFINVVFVVFLLTTLKIVRLFIGYI